MIENTIYFTKKSFMILLEKLDLNAMEKLIEKYYVKSIVLNQNNKKISLIDTIETKYIIKVNKSVSVIYIEH